MSKRLTRKEIKHDIRHDEVQEALHSTWDRLVENPKLIVGSIAGVFALVLVISGAKSFLESRQVQAQEKLAEAIKVASAPIVEEEAKPDDASSPSFASTAERDARARERLESVSGDAADVASLYLADLAAREGDADKARGIWEDFLGKHRDHILAASVRLNLIHLDRAEGRGEQLVSDLESSLASSDRVLTQDILLYELALTLEELGRSDEAIERYQSILDDYPESPYAAEARRATTSS